ncbi:hypothetical protein JWG39_13170 [Desulforhopalus vacuolatus]|uniref:hypothetical protein n=1 Tax=Desulforhopalus vacuolatus TaxID=40414 RepID=UPI001963193F|nr:hypothetical protein [Desulforhopalus vacuolatus]MBM9520767.1 hypothetical protein [Desulforhopalus vacuolatus]
MKRITVLAFALAFAGASLTSCASNNNNGGSRGGQQQQQQPPSFDELDTNSDGHISKDEAKGPLAKDFDKLDANGDGVLTEDELPTQKQGQGQQRQGRM